VLMIDVLVSCGLWVSLVLLGLVVWVSCVYLGCCRFGLSILSQVIGWKDSSEMTCYVSSGTLNSTHSNWFVTLSASVLILLYQVETL